MKKIQIKVLNPEAVSESAKMLVTCARLTQRGHNVKTVDDFVNLYNKDVKKDTYKAMCSLPHNTIQRFGLINVVVVGASRRFLAQITRAQAGWTFMSASLQYSDYSNDADFVIPYEILEKRSDILEERYLESCKASMKEYNNLIDCGVSNDAAGFTAPQGLRNVLVMSGNPLAWKQLIRTRVCGRNSKETQYVMLKIWEELYKLDPILFAPETTGPKCCGEGKFSCKHPMTGKTPSKLLDELFPILRR